MPILEWETLMNWIELVHQEIPGIDDDEAGYILWNHTGFPEFWDSNPEECCRQQLQHVLGYIERGVKLQEDEPYG